LSLHDALPICHHLPDARDAAGPEPACCTLEEARRTGALFVGQDLGVADACRVIDGHVHILPAGAARPVPAVAVDAVADARDAGADARDACELLYVQVHEIARPRSL